ncbi:MAG: [FeFe] hydrogenase H-cluster maturation GTPase HydF [Candidatus Kapaibacterium sp.]
MEKTPKSLRLQLGVFGRTNVGKSSFLNMIAGQDVAMTSEIPGTTTDVVEKAIELLPIGPVTILDTAGIDDTSALAEQRIERARRIFDRADIAILVVEPDKWTPFEDELIEVSKRYKIPFLIVINKTDLGEPSRKFLDMLALKSGRVVAVSSILADGRDEYIKQVKSALAGLLPKEFTTPMPLVGDLVRPGGIAVFIVPIDLQAPKGRLILPQVQSIRDILDSDAISMVVKEREYPHLLRMINQKPDVVVCDSQVVMKMVADTPPDVRCTTFSILFSRFKGDLQEEARGAAMIDHIRPGDRILIFEACSHHAMEDDIGRVKIPRWLRQYLGADTEIDVVAGRDYPKNLKDYKLIIHCGGCMLTRHEKLLRIQKARAAGVPITNYGITISKLQGVIGRVLSPFPAALEAYREAAAPE